MRKASPVSEIVHVRDAEFVCDAEGCEWCVFVGDNRWYFEEDPSRSYCRRECAKENAPEILSRREQVAVSVGTWLRAQGYKPRTESNKLVFTNGNPTIGLTPGAVYRRNEEVFHALGARNLVEAVDAIREASLKVLGHRVRPYRERGPNIGERAGTTYPVGTVRLD